MIYAVGHISGAHFNPAVTLRVRGHTALPVVASFALLARAARRRAARGRAVLRAFARRSSRTSAPRLPSGSQGQAFLWEFVLTFFLMFVIMAVATDTRAVGEAAAIAIGGTVGLDAMFGGPITGASMNPARSIGPAFVSGDLHAPLDLHRRATRGRRCRRVDLPVRARRGEAAGLDCRDGSGMRVLFICVANSGRSVMAERMFNELAGRRHTAESAGSVPGAAAHPAVVEVLSEAGIDATDHVPRRLDDALVARADVVVSTCGEEACPVTPPGTRRVYWDLPGPEGRTARPRARDQRRRPHSGRAAHRRDRPRSHRLGRLPA